MRRVFSTSLLILLLTISARAGYIQNGVTSPPPPPPPAITQDEPTAEGEIQNDAAESFTEMVLTALESVLALL
jgi:hypothetical protein